MAHEHSVSGAFRGYQLASRTARALKYARLAAMGCAAASLALGGLRALRRFREE